MIGWLYLNYQHFFLFQMNGAWGLFQINGAWKIVPTEGGLSLWPIGFESST